MSPVQQPTANHQSETFGWGQTQFFECEALSADHPEIQARKRARQQRLQPSNPTEKQARAVMDLEQELTELQQEMAQVDLLTEGRPRMQADSFEFLVLKLKNLKIKMYQEASHQTPHVHVDYGREHHVASYSIREARRLAGSLDTKYDRVVVGWISNHCDRLLELWTTAQAGNDPGPIIAEISGAA